MDGLDWPVGLRVGLGKVLAVAALIARGLVVLFSDLDVFWTPSFRVAPFLREHAGFDLATMVDRPATHDVGYGNSGFFLMRPSHATAAFLWS